MCSKNFFGKNYKRLLVFSIYALTCAFLNFVLTSVSYAEHPTVIERLFLDEKYFEALVSYKKLPERQRTSRVVDIGIQSAWALGLNQEALSEINYLVERFPKKVEKDARFALTQAIILFQEGELTRASEVVSHMLHSDSLKRTIRGEALLLLGHIAYKKANYEHTNTYVSEALSLLAPDSRADAHLLLGLSFFEIEDYQRSRQHLIELPPEHNEAGRAIKLLSKLAILRSDFNAASAWLKEGQRLFPSIFVDSWVDYALVRIAIARQDREGIFKLLKKAQEKYPPSDVWMSLLESTVEIYLTDLDIQKNNKNKILKRRA